jgi:hypothetical protein
MAKKPIETVILWIPFTPWEYFGRGTAGWGFIAVYGFWTLDKSCPHK